MKKALCVLLATVMCLALFVGCDSRPEATQGTSQTQPLNPASSATRNTDPVSVVDGPFDGLSAFLDNEQFVPGLSQKAFREQVEGYRYEGASLADHVMGSNYDGVYGGGYRGVGKLFSYRNDYQTTEDELFANYSNTFYTMVPLEGLKLPYGIAFTDTVKDAFEKMSLKFDPCTEFVANEGSDTDMTLFRDDKITLTLRDMGREKSPVEYLMRFKLIYTEVYTVQRADGRTATVTREVELAFSTIDDTLYRVSMYVNEYYKR